MDDDEDFLIDDPFDDDGGEEAPDPFADPDEGAIDISSLLRELGFDGYSDIVIDFSDVDTSELRGQRFDTIDEAIIYLYDIGILSFSEVVELDDGTYGYVVTYGGTDA